MKRSTLSSALVGATLTSSAGFSAGLLDLPADVMAQVYDYVDHPGEIVRFKRVSKRAHMISQTLKTRPVWPIHRVEVQGVAFEFVRLPRFNGQTLWVQKTLMTQAQYEALELPHVSQYRGPQRPVTNLTFRDADHAGELLTALKGDGRYEYVLPSEAEWEFAELAGGLYTPKGLDPQNLGPGYEGRQRGGGAPEVGSHVNAFGLSQMLGSVWHFTRTLHENSTPEKVVRVLRGASWSYDRSNLRVSDRNRASPADANANLGFRLVRHKLP